MHYVYVQTTYLCSSCHAQMTAIEHLEIHLVKIRCSTPHCSEYGRTYLLRRRLQPVEAEYDSVPEKVGD